MKNASERGRHSKKSLVWGYDVLTSSKLLLKDSRTKAKPAGARLSRLLRGSGSSKLSLSQAMFALLLGVPVEAFHLLPLLDAALSYAANVVSPLPPQLLPTSFS